MSRPEIPDATDAEEQEIRADIEQWVVIGGSAKTRQKLHIADDDDCSLCAQPGIRGNVAERDRERMVPKPVAVYPPGFHDLCRYCVQAWREDKHDD
jgi:hypothetical protein